MLIYKIECDGDDTYVFGRKTLLRYQSDGYFVTDRIIAVELETLPRDIVYRHLMEDIMYLPEHDPTEREMDLLYSYAKEIYFNDESLQDTMDDR